MDILEEFRNKCETETPIFLKDNASLENVGEKFRNSKGLKNSTSFIFILNSNRGTYDDDSLIRVADNIGERFPR